MQAITITKHQLLAALLNWELDARDGKTIQPHEARALPTEQVAAQNAEYLWLELQGAAGAAGDQARKKASSVEAVGETFMRRPAVEAVTGYGRSSIYELMKAGRFPMAVKLSGGHAVAWRASEIRAWIKAQGSSACQSPLQPTRLLAGSHEIQPLRVSADEYPTPT